jgi:16S rRNA (guanine527-N7)-methyltransferase
VTPETTERLQRFAALLLRWNATLNLVAARDASMIWDRHILDSLQLLPLMPTGLACAIDLGSGGGFPGMVLAIASNTPFHLIEADRRKASFLRSAVLETGAPATIHACRIEDADIPPARLVTARALAPLHRLLPLAMPFLAADGVALFLKGARTAEEIHDARLYWQFDAAITPSQTSAYGCILRVSNLTLHPAIMR